jgi:ribosome maturation protein Sdo1
MTCTCKRCVEAHNKQELEDARIEDALEECEV